jgi:hypothetical protein
LDAGHPATPHRTVLLTVWVCAVGWHLS